MHSFNQIQKLKKKKQCVFFVVPGNSQALLGIPGTAVLNIINLNIDSIQAKITKCKTNRGQEMHAVMEGCTNRDTDVITKQDTNSQNTKTSRLIMCIHQKI